MITESIFRIGINLRNPGLWKYYDFLKESQFWSYSDLQSYQIKKLKEIIDFAKSHSSFYSEMFKEVDIHADVINSILDLKNLPIIEKQDLLDNNIEIHSHYNFDKMFFSETSGSSGQVLKFYKNLEWDNFNRANLYKYYDWYDVKPWGKNGYFWGYNFGFRETFKTRIQDKLQNRYRLFRYDDKSIKSFIRNSMDASYIHGYSSMINHVATRINELGFGKAFKNLKLVKGTSEKIYPAYQKESEKAFGKRVVSEYGAAESGLIAFECPEGNMHISMETVIVEEVDNEIIVTNLFSKSFPIIRYKLGDYIRLKDPAYECPCGRKHQIIEEILGRVGKSVLGIRNEYPSLTFYYIFKNLALDKRLDLNYQVIQNKKGRLIFKIEQSLNDRGRSLLDDEIGKYFNGDIKYHIKDKQELRTDRGKLRDFISTIN